MIDSDYYDAAARITSSLIVAGHLPALNVRGVDDSAAIAADLFNAVLKELRNFAVFSEVQR